MFLSTLRVRSYYFNNALFGAIHGRQKELILELFDSDRAYNYSFDFGQALKIAKNYNYADIIDILKDELRKINSNSIYLTMY